MNWEKACTVCTGIHLSTLTREWALCCPGVQQQQCTGVNKACISSRHLIHEAIMHDRWYFLSARTVFECWEGILYSLHEASGLMKSQNMHAPRPETLIERAIGEVPQEIPKNLLMIWKGMHTMHMYTLFLLSIYRPILVAFLWPVLHSYRCIWSDRICIESTSSHYDYKVNDKHMNGTGIRLKTHTRGSMTH